MRKVFLIVLILVLTCCKSYDYEILTIDKPYLKFIKYNLNDATDIHSDSTLQILKNKMVVDIHNEANYPHPFMSRYSFQFYVENEDSIKLDLHSSKGEYITTILNKVHNPGKYLMKLVGPNIKSGNYQMIYYKDNKHWIYDILIKD